MWVVMIVIALGVIGIIAETAADGSVEWDVLWHVLKKVIWFILAMAFLPLVIIFGRSKTRESKKDSP